MFIQFMKYNLVGVVNTLIGFSMIIVLMAIGVSATLSNIVGYVLGACVSYVLNSKYTFSSSENHKEKMLKFFMVLGLAYILNFVTLQWLLTWINPYLAQLISAVVYTGSSFLMFKYFAFKEAG